MLRNANPFEKDGPTEFENWLYVMGQAHGSLIFQQTQQIETLTAAIAEHINHHQAANKAVLGMPPISQTEKPS